MSEEYALSPQGWEDATALVSRLAKSEDRTDEERILLAFVAELLETFTVMLGSNEEASLN